jgi:hypothetical protein
MTSPNWQASIVDAATASNQTGYPCEGPPGEIEYRRMTAEDFDGLPDDAAKVFLSYSRKDRENDQRIADILREK